tara:strand:- start:1587 stop:1778 length:192 start_codon:yes stop_codon:yes gene_type:complete
MMGGNIGDIVEILIHPTLCFFEPFFNMEIHGFLWIFMGEIIRTFRTALKIEYVHFFYNIHTHK